MELIKRTESAGVAKHFSGPYHRVCRNVSSFKRTSRMRDLQVSGHHSHLGPSRCQIRKIITSKINRLNLEEARSLVLSGLTRECRA
jgi:hypothetical protein